MTIRLSWNDTPSEIGSHILSGNVFDPKALHELFPDKITDWTKELLDATGSHATPVTKDQFLVLTESGGSYTIPNLFLPPQLLNTHGNYIISLSQLCRWLAQKAEDLGVEIYPGFAASEVLVHPHHHDNNNNNNKHDNHNKLAVRGIATRNVGCAKDGTPKATFARGVELCARQTLFAEGARGSCTEWLIQHLALRSSSPQQQQPQTYGLGLKEVWQIPANHHHHQPGLVQHTLGYPLQNSLWDKTFGGSFLYHQHPDLVLVGLVVGLDYANPYLNPYQEFQRWKTHPAIASQLQGGTCVSYGARVLNEGGLHSIPQLTFPGGALLGCAAGFLNAVKIKGSHTAMKSGMLAAEAAHAALTNSTDKNNSVAATGELPADEAPIELTAYATAIQNSWVHQELYEVRNTHEAFARWGVGGGLLYTGLATHITKGREPWTLRQHDQQRDADTTDPADQHQPIHYPAPDGKLTFDLLTNLQRSGVYHEEDQPSHLRIKPEYQHVPERISLQVYGAPETRFCPAAVYEYVDDHDDNNNNADDKKGNADDKKKKKLVINAQNCIHCKCCSIKMPSEYIDWTVPEGGGGPQYQTM